MTATTTVDEREQLEARAAELETEVARIRAAIPDLLRRLEAGAAQRDLEARRTVLDGRLAANEAALAGAKADAKRRKREIDEWKLWHEGQPTAGARARLDHEVAWRAEAIARDEQRIAELAAMRMELLGERELLDVARPDPDGTPPSEDPRVEAARKALRWAERELADTRAQLDRDAGGAA